MSNRAIGRAIPLVSVVVPCLNGARFLRDCLKSLVAQTYSNLEIVFTDDGSSDQSVECALAIARTDTRIKVLTSALPCGMAANWNRGMHAATGKYISKLDCDDTMHPSAVEELVGGLESGAAPLASFCRAQVADEQLHVLGSFADTYWEKSGLNPCVDQVLSTERLRSIAYGWTPLWNSSSLMISRQMLLALGGWDERFRCVADVDLILRILNRSGVVAHRSLIGVCYRIVEGSVSKRAAVGGWLGDELRVAHLKNFEELRRSGADIPAGLCRYYRGLRRDLLAGSDVLSVVESPNDRNKLEWILLDQPRLRASERAASWLRRLQRAAVAWRPK